MKTILQRSAVACAAVFATGCATAPGSPRGSNPFQEMFASEDPCSNNARNIGIAGGVVLGTLVGHAMGAGKTESLVIGAALGGLVGGVIGADIDRKRCELAKVAKKYDLDIAYADIQSNQQSSQVVPVVIKETNQAAPGTAAQQAGLNSKDAAATIVGNVVTIRDKEGAAGHFMTGSDQLTPKAQEYFAAIASQYAPDTMLDGVRDPARKSAMVGQLSKRRILLIGHTDDTGSTTTNASLSERRARTVAAYLQQNGIAKEMLFYQGAGEGLPVADNRTDAGRAVNRRVEIVELADDASFKLFLDSRKPEYAFYRAKPPVSAASKPAVLVSAPEVQKTKKTQKTQAVVKNKNTKKPPIVPQIPVQSDDFINFGGVPYAPSMAKIETGAMLHEGTFSIISKAFADESVLLADCSYDRPRAIGKVKSLGDGKIYKTTEHLPQLYGKTWASYVNNNLVLINRLALLRDGGAPANLPELKVYANHKMGSKTPPDITEEPQVNSYRVDKGVLYRIFPQPQSKVQCMDVLFALDGSTQAKAGKIIYTANAGRFVADFKPQIQ